MTRLHILKLTRQGQQRGGVCYLRLRCYCYRWLWCVLLRQLVCEHPGTLSATIPYEKRGILTSARTLAHRTCLAIVYDRMQPIAYHTQQGLST